MKHYRYFLLLPVFFLATTHLVHPQESDADVARRYALWAQNTIDQGLWNEASAGLERAFDFADVSSDISYLLAITRSHAGMPREAVLQALEFALYVNHWDLYRADDARLLKAEYLIALRAYPEALFELSLVSEGIRRAELILKALSPWRPMEFRNYMRQVLDRYPRETEPVRIFFNHIKNENIREINPGIDDLEILDLVNRRLELLIPDDPELAWMAAPFQRNTEDGRRLISAYRAVNDPVPASIPAALFFGIINEESAIEELFYGQSMDINLLSEVWNLLEQEESRLLFRRNLFAYSGVITEDADMDGFPETFAEYRDGVLVRSVYDSAQSGIPDLVISYEAGIARQALVLIPPEGSRQTATVQWERYPAVFEVELDGVSYIPRPLDFFYSPIRFVELWGSGLLFPQRDQLSPALTRRVLVFHSLRIQRPSLEFRSGIEVVELSQGIPVRAREYVGSLMVSETEFLHGRPQFQRIDLDLDGRMETVRFFRQDNRELEIEVLWDYEREIEYIIRN